MRRNAFGSIRNRNVSPRCKNGRQFGNMNVNRGFAWSGWSLVDVCIHMMCANLSLMAIGCEAKYTRYLRNECFVSWYAHDRCGATSTS